MVRRCRSSNICTNWRSNDEQGSGTITRQREGHVLRAFGEEVIVYLDGEHTSGKLAMWTNITPPGGGSPPHYHSNEDETFYVLEGRVAFLADGQWRENSTFKNVGDQPSRILITATPSGLEILRALR